VALGLGETALLGGVAGATIFLGLPVGRVRRVGDRVRVALAMFSVGILAFIFVDVMAHGQEIVEDALNAVRSGESSPGRLVGLVALLAGGLLLGTLGIAAVERGWLRSRRQPPPAAGGEAGVALGAREIAALGRAPDLARRQALVTGMSIAAAIGLHNFAEGLAIGVSAGAGEIALATVLIIGFALHNATEGFGIVGPLGDVRPSWMWLGVAGLVGGGPTFLGALVGYGVTSEPLELCFYALAGGAILYVIGEVWNGVRRFGHRELGLAMLSVGFLVGVATDLVVAYGGG
jgi:ZIP family zinc transporter